MPRPPRTQYTGAFYHLYNRGVAKLPIVRDDQDRCTFMKLWSETVQNFQMRLFAYCLMGNHYHFFVQTLGKNLSEAMWYFSINYCRYFNERHERVGPVYQGRYQSRLVNQQTYGLILPRYIHQNPLEAGLVKELQDYSWSSYGSYTGHLPRWNGLETEWLLKQFAEKPEIAKEAFIQFHKSTSPPKEKRKLSSMRAKLT